MYDEIKEFFKTRTCELTLSKIIQDKLLRRKTMVGMGLAIVMQVTGINAVLFYSNTLFKNGKDDREA